MQRPGKIRQRLVVLSLFGLLLFSPAVIGLFDRGADTTLFGIPVLVLYFFGSWSALIGLAYWVISGSKKAESENQ